MGKTVKLNSRYGLKNYLESLDDHRWVLRSSIDSIRVGLNKDNRSEYTFIDPPGGPFMAIGSLIDEINEVVEFIDFVENVGYVITTKENGTKK